MFGSYFLLMKVVCLMTSSFSSLWRSVKKPVNGCQRCIMQLFLTSSMIGAIKHRACQKRRMQRNFQSSYVKPLAFSTHAYSGVGIRLMTTLCCTATGLDLSSGLCAYTLLDSSLQLRFSLGYHRMKEFERIRSKTHSLRFSDRWLLYNFHWVAWEDHFLQQQCTHIY